MPVELLVEEYTEQDDYQVDVFSSMDDDDIAKEFNKAKKRLNKKSKQKSCVKRQKKSSVLPKSVVELQSRYDEIANNENATSKDWESFYLSIEKLVMKQAYFNNFKKYISKDSDLWSYLISTLMDMIIPKKNIDGSRSCWYINKTTNKICKGYDPEKSNIGNFILNRIKWIIFDYNKNRTSETDSLTDLDAMPIPDIFEFPEIQKNIKDSEQIRVIGNPIEYSKNISMIMKFHSMAIL